MAKRILLATLGTRGDVQPVSVLAQALADAGYDVRLAVPENFLSGRDRDGLFQNGRGLEVVKCGPDMRALLEDPEIKEILSGGVFTKIKRSRSALRKWLSETMTDIIAAGNGVDAILFHPKASFAIDVAEAVGAKPILFAFQPFTPTRKFPFFIFPWRSLGGWLNRLSYCLLYLSRIMLGGTYNKARKDVLNLDPTPRFGWPYSFKGQSVPTLYSFSPTIVPKPCDWPDDVYVTGYWLPPATTDGGLPEDIQTFLQSGPPPLYVGFGSMPVDDPDAKSRMLVEAIKKSGARAVISRGWGGLEPMVEGKLHDRILLIDSVPHETLFPHMAGIVHHGGAGTTHMALSAGRPQLICPFLVDQPFWGRQVHALGVGPAPLPPKKWTVERLAEAFEDLANNKDYARSAERAGEAIRRENGVGDAVELVRKLVGEP